MYFDTPLFTSGTATARLLVSKTRHLLQRHRTFKWRSKQPFVTLTPTLALSLPRRAKRGILHTSYVVEWAVRNWLERPGVRMRARRPLPPLVALRPPAWGKATNP